jgi:hypothetical protein
VKPLTTANAVGNGVPATADLVTVQNGLFNAVAALGAELRADLDRLEDNMNATLKDGRDVHHAEHAELQTQIKDWQKAQAQSCALLMQPYAPMGYFFRFIELIARHKKTSIMIGGAILTAFFVAAAFVGGILLPGR